MKFNNLPFLNFFCFSHLFVLKLFCFDIYLLNIKTTGKSFKKNSSNKYILIGDSLEPEPKHFYGLRLQQKSLAPTGSGSTKLLTTMPILLQFQSYHYSCNLTTVLILLYLI